MQPALYQKPDCIYRTGQETLSEIIIHRVGFLVKHCFEKEYL